MTATLTTPAPSAWLEQAELLLSVDQPDGTRHSLPLDDPRMAAAWPIWLERLRDYERAEEAKRAATTQEMVK